MKSRLNLLAIIATAFVVSGIAQAAAPKSGTKVTKFDAALKASKAGNHYAAIEAIAYGYKGKGLGSAQAHVLYKAILAVLNDAEAVIYAELEDAITLLEKGASWVNEAKKCRVLFAARRGEVVRRPAIRHSDDEAMSTGDMADNVSAAGRSDDGDLKSAAEASHYADLASARAQTVAGSVASAAAASVAVPMARASDLDEADAQSEAESTGDVAPAAADSIAVTHARNVRRNGATAAGTYARPTPARAVPRTVTFGANRPASMVLPSHK